MKLLIKIASRERPQMLFNLLDELVKRFSGENEYQILVSCDNDDIHMRNQIVFDKLSLYDNLSVFFSEGTGNKIEACNRDVEKIHDWDVLIALDDDMMPVKDGYDKYISEGFEKYFPDGDGVLWFCDGHRDDLLTFAVLGKKYYNRFGYIWNPAYISFFCDNEFHAVANRLGKIEKYCWPECIIEHQHYSFSHDCRGNDLNGADALQVKNRVSFAKDAHTFSVRSKRNFDI